MEGDGKTEGDSAAINPSNTVEEAVKDAEKKPNDQTNDEELSELLDSALADFDKPALQPAVTGAENTDSVSENAEKGEAGANLTAEQEALFNDIFASGLADEATKHFEDAMKSLMSEDPTMMEHLQKLSVAAEHLGDGSDSQQNFVEALQSTVCGMAKNAEGLQEGDISEDDIMKAMSSLGLGPEIEGQTDEGQGQPGFIPIMQQMMKSLLSKEVLYPSLKEISEKYPEWLEKNQANVEADKYENYNKQYVLMKNICDEFDAESDSDSDEIKRARFERILDLMQQMQECGQPPPEIVGEMAPGLHFDENGLPKLPDGAAPQCSAM